MSGPAGRTSKMFASVIAAYNESELEEFLEKNGQLIELEDPENYLIVIQRLRLRPGANATVSDSIDLDYISARLNAIPSDARLNAIPLDRETSPQSPSLASTVCYDPEEQYPHELVLETERYDKLVEQGGRPSHPISLGRDILDMAGSYEILSYWQDGPDKWEVFGPQLRKWQRFHEHQKLKRKERGRFLRYSQSLKDCLARQKFMRPFRLNENLDQQDKLATWVEFLGCESLIYERHAATIERLRPQVHEAWQKLVDSKVLRPSESAESLFKIENIFQRMNEGVEAEDAVEKGVQSVEEAQTALNEERNTGVTGRSLTLLEAKLTTSKSQLVVLTTSLELIKKRGQLFHIFGDQSKEYETAKYFANKQSVLLRWISQQIPLIELEVGEKGNFDINQETVYDSSSPHGSASQKQKGKLRKQQKPVGAGIKKRQPRSAKPSIHLMTTRSKTLATKMTTRRGLRCRLPRQLVKP